VGVGDIPLPLSGVFTQTTETNRSRANEKSKRQCYYIFVIGGEGFAELIEQHLSLLCVCVCVFLSEKRRFKWVEQELESCHLHPFGSRGMNKETGGSGDPSIIMSHCLSHACAHTHKHTHTNTHRHTRFNPRGQSKSHTRGRACPSERLMCWCGVGGKWSKALSTTVWPFN